MWPDWDDNIEEDFSHYEYSSFNPGFQGIDEQIFQDSIFEYNGSWLPSEGTYGFAVRAVDEAGNKSAWAISDETLEGSCQITYDSTPPFVEIVSPTESLLTGEVEIRGTVTDKHPHHYWLQIKKNGTVISSKTVNESDSFTNRPLATLTDDGDYEVTLAARDATGGTSKSGNRSADVIKSFTIDNTAPNIPTPNNPNNDTNPFYTGDAFTQTWSDESATGAVKYEYLSCYQPTDPSNNECPAGAKTWTDTYTGTSKSVGANQADSHFFWHIRSVDSIGNKSDWSEWREIVIDSTAPVFINSTDFGTTWYNTVQTSTFNYTDANGIVSGTPVICDITTEGPDQTCSVTPNVCDEAGNCNTIPVISNGANIDKAFPESTISYPIGENGSTIYINTWNGVITGTASDALSGVAGVKISIQRSSDKKYWDGSNWIASVNEVLNDQTTLSSPGAILTNWSYDFDLIEDNSYIFSSHAIDEAGNVENTYTLTIVYDKTIPEVNLTINPSSPNGDNDWYISEPMVTLTASDTNLDKIEYQIDSETGTWMTYSGSVKIDEGEHVFYYRALDLAGNYSNVGVKNVKVDTEDPEISNLDAEYKADIETVKLTWDVEGDVDRTYIYRGGSRGFDLNGSTRLAKQDGNDDTYNDDDVRFGKKYYYKVIGVDEAGNESDVEIVSVRIDENGEAVVTQEGT